VTGMRLAMAGAFAFTIAFAFCVIAAAWRWHPAVTGACIVPCVAGLVGCVLWLHLRGDRQ